ncbi:MAG: Bug family tripartite tricarboxylate transporter substrate binding protein [Hyphomicrobiaceae bacterium]
MRLLPRLLSLLVLGLATTLPAAAQAPAYPNRPIQLVVTVPPGGAADFVARLIGGRLQETLGQPIIVVNKGGAGGTIATDFVAKSKNDGYTLLLNAISTHGIGPHLYKSLPYDPNKDFAPIGLVAQIPLIMTIHKDVPAKSVADVIALAKSQPGKIAYASPGKGGAPHLTAELFKLVTSTDLLHVPYKGSGPAVIDLAAGRVQIMFDGVPALKPHLDSGALRALAAASDKRNPLLPELPTFQELGFKGLEVSLWYGLVAPAGTPDAILVQLNGELQKALAHPQVTDGFSKQAVNAAPGTPAQFAAFMRDEQERWGKVVKAAGIEAD